MRRRYNCVHLRCLLFSVATIATILLVEVVLRVEALPKPTNKVNGDKEIKPPTASEAKDIILDNLNENYQSSSKALVAVNKKLEDDFKERQLKMRKYWEQTFEEIKTSNPVIFGEDGLESSTRRKNSDEKILERWKQFVVEPPPLLVDEGAPLGTGSKGSNRTSLGPGTKIIQVPPRFDGFQTWETRLQQWAEDVSLYINETEKELNELLQPKEPSRYDLSNFGVSSQRLKDLTREEAEFDTVDDKSGSKREHRHAKFSIPKPAFGPRDTTTTAPIGTLPIALTALDKTLPPIPKPRPVTPSDEILPHTNIADKSKNIWIVTTGALPWMTGTAVNPLLRAAYLSTGRKEAGGSVTLMLPWVEREDDQKRVYGKRMFDTPDDQEEYIRTWLRDTANMKKASEELNIKWYTAWQEVLENSLYSMGDIIGLIPVSLCSI